MQATKRSINHQCQIDCTNHDQVINTLELKSKDLYYFWRNYQWLYNKYYSQDKSVTKQVVISNDSDEQKQKVIVENRKLRIEIQLLKKQVEGMSSNTSNKRVEEEYQREIIRLKTKCEQYEKIRQKQIIEISTLTSSLRAKDDLLADSESKWRRELKRQEQIIIDLQTTIDGLRAKLMNNGNMNEQSASQIKEAFRRETTRTQNIITRLEERCYDIIEHDLEQTRKQLLDLFPQVLYRFSSGDLSSLINQEEERG